MKKGQGSRYSIHWWKVEPDIHRNGKQYTPPFLYVKQEVCDWGIYVQMHLNNAFKTVSCFTSLLMLTESFSLLIITADQRSWPHLKLSQRKSEWPFCAAEVHTVYYSWPDVEVSWVLIHHSGGVCVCVCACVSSLVCVVGYFNVRWYSILVLRVFFFLLNWMFQHDCLDTYCFWVSYMHMFSIFCICTCSAQLSMFHMEKRSRNTLIIIIIIIIIIYMWQKSWLTPRFLWGDNIPSSKHLLSTLSHVFAFCNCMLRY